MDTGILAEIRCVGYDGGMKKEMAGGCVHLIGIGGINMSAVAVLLHRAGVRVTGSDVKWNEDIDRLEKMGVKVMVGHDAANIGDAELVLTTSAIRSTNVELLEANERKIRVMNNFAFLGEWFARDRVVLVTGTHGKSTTTGMLGVALVDAGLDPTVIVGSRVTSFPDANLRIGSSDLVVIEGDEYAKHFLSFQPFAVLVNNIELDHTDVFQSLGEMQATFVELLKSIPSSGFVVANREDPHVVQVIEIAAVEDVRWWGRKEAQTVELTIPGPMNRMNAAGALTMALALHADEAKTRSSLREFPGIWRRMEKIGEHNGALVYSDYGHHPTAVRETLAAFREAFPGKRIILCFQPHHRNRTKHLFLDFVPSFDDADTLILAEIFDVAGRDAAEDENITSDDLADAIIRHDADRGMQRPVVFTQRLEDAVAKTLALADTTTVIVFMSAGDLDGEARTRL